MKSAHTGVQALARFLESWNRNEPVTAEESAVLKNKTCQFFVYVPIGSGSRRERVAPAMQSIFNMVVPFDLFWLQDVTALSMVDAPSTVWNAVYVPDQSANSI